MKLFSLNPDTYNPSALETANGTPFLLAKPGAKPVKRTAPNVAVIEELAKAKGYDKAQAANFNEMMNSILNPMAPQLNELAKSDGTPYYLARKKPTALETTKVISKRPNLQVIEELAAISNQKRKAKSAGVPKPPPPAPPVAEPPPLNIEASAPPVAPEATPEQRLIDEYYKLMEKRNGRLGDLEEEYNDLRNQKPEGWKTVDLTQLMGWADDTYGGNTAKYYKAPTAVKDWEAKVKEARNLMLGSEQQLTEDQFNLLAKKMAEDQYKYIQTAETGRNDADNRTAIEVAKINATSPRNNENALGWANLMQRQMEHRDQLSKEERGDNKALAMKLAPHSMFKSALADAQSLLQQFPDAPGLGSSLIFGTVTPDSELSDNGKTRRALARVAAAHTKMMSGAAASDQERAALDIITGKTWRANEDSIRDALATLMESQQTEEATIRSGFEDYVNSTIDQRSKARTPSKGVGKPKVIIQDGYTYTLNPKTGQYE